MSSNEESLKDAKSLHKTSVSDEVVIKFDHVTKTYNLYKNDRGRFLGIFNYNRKGSFLGSVDASKDLSFEIKKGEAVAFLGRNGAGKSTTLKMVTGVTHPTSGEIRVEGRVSALLELTAGFDSQLTGRENISLRGQILGLNRSEIKELEPDIIDFAELGLYIDQPMRTYSSGMKARLGFAFAVAIDPEILVVDEALSVGDRAFQKKCIDRIREIMMDENVTVLQLQKSFAAGVLCLTRARRCSTVPSMTRRLTTRKTIRECPWNVQTRFLTLSPPFWPVVRVRAWAIPISRSNSSC